ncbi:MAG: hypothetical protein KIT69_12250, partial [Propionibacteriaceae bacterium]|nr:hypothetical protein [Propionibacteriaceae bacterium]
MLDVADVWTPATLYQSTIIEQFALEQVWSGFRRFLASRAAEPSTSGRQTYGRRESAGRQDGRRSRSSIPNGAVIAARSTTVGR